MCQIFFLLTAKRQLPDIINVSLSHMSWSSLIVGNDVAAFMNNYTIET